MTVAPLYPFQKDAIQRVAKGEQLYLGFDMGLGKSRTALEIAGERNASRVLVICQASGRYVWEREANKWTPLLPVTIVRGLPDIRGLANPGIVVVTYGLLSQKDSPFVAAVAKGKPFDLTILDEASAVKNSGSNRTRAILGKMLSKLGYVLPLSGTPAPNHAGELYPILKALHPTALHDGGGKVMDQWMFEDTFCKVVTKRFGGGDPVRVIEGSRNLPFLRRRLEGFMLRVRKEDVLRDLPPVRYDIVPLDVDGDTVRGLPAVPPFTDDDDVLAYLSGKVGDEHVMRLRRMLGVAKVKPAAEYIDDFLQGLAPDRKVLVFAHHKDVIRGLVEGLADWNLVQITGASTPTERSNAVNAFLNGTRCRMMIANIQAAGTGLTLVGPNCKCSDVIFVEASYSVGDNVQAAARVHRIGQNDAVVARFLTAHGTIDDRIQAILARKATDFANLFN